MPTIAEIRQKYPQYQDMSDGQLADALHKKFYSDIPQADFYSKIGFDQQSGPNPDGTYGQPPEGMVLNPATGQMEDLRSPINPNIPQGGANALGLGVGQGAGFNMLDEASAALTVPFGGDYDYNLGRMREAERRASSDHPVSYYGGSVGGALGTGAGLASGGLSATNAAINAGWRLPAVSVASGLEGGALGAAYGFGAGEGAENRSRSAVNSGTVGLGIGAAAPWAIAGASKAFQKVRAPFQTSPERAAAAKVLEAEGVPLTAGQKTGSKWLQYRESELGGARAADLMDDQAKAFTEAAMKRAGGKGLATSDNMADMARRIGQGFDDVSSRNALQLDRQIITDFNKATQEYARVLPTEQKGIYQALRHDIAERFKAGKGVMTGADYQTVRSRLTRMAQSYKNSDGEFSSAIRGLRNALDEGMERSITPQDAGVWSELRRQYGNMKVLERAANGGGEAAGAGVISPARLRMAASAGNRSGYARGQGDFAQLAKAGQTLMTPLPNSGTAQRIAAQGVAAALLGGGGSMVGGPYGFALGLAGPALAGKGLMSGPIQNYLASQAGGAMSNQTRGLLNMLTNINATNIQRRVKAGN